MSAAILNPYRTLSAGLADMPRPDMKLVFGSSGPHPGALDLGGGEHSLGSDSDWNPDLHNLTVSCTLENTVSLAPMFGVGGVAATDAALMLSLEWTSAESGWRGLGRPLRLTLAELLDGTGTLSLLFVLPAGSMRGTGTISVQAFLGEPGIADRGDAGLARSRGARLGMLSNQIRVVIDGDGSLFPVVEEDLGADGALWEMRSTWNDPRDETFTSEFVALVLNCKHELFGQLRQPAGRQGQMGQQPPLMRHVLASWIALFVLKVGTDLGKDFDDLVARPTLSDEFASIADAAALLVRSGDLDTRTPDALFASVQRWLDQRVRATSTETAQ